TSGVNENAFIFTSFKISIAPLSFTISSTVPKNGMLRLGMMLILAAILVFGAMSRSYCREMVDDVKPSTFHFTMFLSSGKSVVSCVNPLKQSKLKSRATIFFIANRYLYFNG